MEALQACVRGLTLCSTGAREQGEALLRATEFPNSPHEPFETVVRHCVRVSASVWMPHLRSEPAATARMVRWSAGHLVGLALGEEWTTLVGAALLLLQDAAGDVAVQGDALRIIAHVLAQQGAVAAVTRWHSRATLVSVVRAHTNADAVAEVALPLASTLVMCCEDVAAQLTWMEQLLASARRLSATQPYRDRCNAQVVALMRNHPDTFIAVLPAVVDHVLELLQARADCDLVLELATLCVACDAHTHFCSVALATGLRVLATRAGVGQDVAEHCRSLERRIITP